MRRLWIAEGRVIETPNFDDLWRTQLRVQLIGASSVGDLLRAPLGNHITVLEGHHANVPADWWDLMIAGSVGG